MRPALFLTCRVAAMYLNTARTAVSSLAEPRGFPASRRQAPASPLQKHQPLMLTPTADAGPDAGRLSATPRRANCPSSVWTS